MLLSLTGRSADVCKAPWDLWADDVTGISFWGFQLAFDEKRKSTPFLPPFSLNFCGAFHVVFFFF